MTDKKWTFALLLATIAVAGVFASGDKEEDVRERGPRMEDLETDTYTGTFTMEDSLYPALITDAGDTWYLMIPFKMEENNIPEEGAEITVEAAESPRSPEHLMVVSAIVDGEELELEFPEEGERGGKGMKGGGPPGQNPPGRS